MRYRIKDADGRELTVPSLEALEVLYRDGLVADEDLVRAETAERWMRAGLMQALQGTRRRRTQPRWAALVLLAAIALAVIVALVQAR